MIRLPPRSTRTDTLCPYTTLFRSAVEADIVIAEVVGDDQDDVRRALSLGSLRRALLPGDRAVWLNGIVPVLNYTGDAIFIRLEGPISARAGEEQCGEGEPSFLHHLPHIALSAYWKTIGTICVTI